MTVCRDQVLLKALFISQQVDEAIADSGTGKDAERSISFKTEARPFPAAPLRPRVKNTPSKRRNSLLWSDTVESISEELSAKEIKRQEFPCLDSYITYCCNLVAAKALLDHKKQERRVDEFLRLCQESSFSRKLDLWNFLDLPRSRLVKYPLLLKEILRHTSSEHPDLPHLEEAMELIQRIVGQVNSKTGEAESQYYQSSLCFQDDNQKLPEIQRSRLLHCHGELKNSKGQVSVVSPQSTLEGKHMKKSLDPEDWDTRLAKNFFRVSSRGRWKGQAHSLQASDSFNKQQWVSCIRQAIISFKDQLNSSHRSLLNQSADSSLDDIADLSIDSDDKVGVDMEMS
ncbi:UNVERIFIED_CONTAM: hypothetical protein FKN15_057415 [Acipenser sinensis]